MRIQSMQDLFIEQIQDLYDAEERLIKALPKMAEATTSAELRSAFEDHFQETKQQLRRLERVFDELGIPAGGETCEAMKGLIKEGEEIIGDVKQSALRDAGLIAAANRVEHYEIAAYGTARTFAESLGLTQAVGLLGETLEEEKQADEKLTRIAESTVNIEAMKGGVRTAR